MVAQIDLNKSDDIRCHEFFDLSPDLLVIADNNGRFLQVNDAWQTTLGWTPEELLAETFLSFVHPDDIDATLHQIERQKQGEKVQHFSNRYRNKDGSYRWLEWTASRETDGRIYAIARDKTETKRIEQERDRFFNISIDLLVIANTDGTFRKVNDRWTEILGWESEELLNRPFFDFVHPDDIEPTVVELEREKKGERVIEFVNRYRCKDGSYRWLEWTTQPEPDGTIYAVARDVTDRKKAEETLIASELQKKTILNTIPNLVWLKDLEGTYLDCNPSFESFLGTQKNQIIGRKDFDLVDAELATIARRKDLEALNAKGPITNEEWVVFATSDERVLLEVTKTPLQAADGSFYGVLSVGHDITSRKEIEERNRHLAMTDPLTGLANRTYFEERVNQSLRLAKREGSTLALMMIDVDDFKPINDTFGHPFGDAVLKEVANNFAKFTRETDVVARLGGDEFAILMVNPANEKSPAIEAQRLIRECRKITSIMNEEVMIGVSIGIALYPHDANCINDLIKKADIALYDVKENGRGHYRFYAPLINI